jgi:uncharacterized protein with HEPN domain
VRDVRERLLDILEAIERIERYAARGKAAFESDELIQVWIVSHIQIIGEASNALSEKVRATHHDVPWRQIIGMRHILVHHYFDVDLDVVWSTVKRDLPPLKRAIQAMLEESAGKEPD